MLARLKLAYLAAMQERLIFKPYSKRIAPMLDAEAYGLTETQEISLQTEDKVALRGWLHYEPNKPLIVFFHGNTGHFGDVGKPKRGEVYDRYYRITLLKTLQENGFSFLAVSLRGYGKSDPAPPSEAGFAKDVAAIRQYIKHELHYHLSELTILGESLGASTALMMAAQLTDQGTPPKLVVSIAAFYSVLAKVTEQHTDLDERAVKAKLRHLFDNAAYLKRLTKQTTLLLLAPADDETTPKSHSQSLASLAETEKLDAHYAELANAGHITWDAGEVVEAIKKTQPNE